MQNEQSYSNHVRIHPAYHYFALPISLALILLTMINLILDFGLNSFIAVIISLLLHLIIFLTRSYAKQNQDRIIRAELRLRYFQLTGRTIDALELQLSLGQLLALRFATDDEFRNLIDNPATIQMTAADIKRSIRKWNPDYMRV